MEFKKFYLIICVFAAASYGFKPKCLSVPSLPAKVDTFIKTCQSEIKSNIIDDLVHTTLHENPYSGAEFSDLLKPHFDHIQHQAKYKHKHHGFGDPFKKPLKDPHLHDYEYFEPDNSQFWQKFASFQSANAAISTHQKEPEILQSVEQSPSFPEYLIDNSFHRITPSTNIKFATPPTQVEERNEKIESDKKDQVVEARDELLNILANHKIVQRQTYRKNSRNSTRITKNNSTVASTIESRRDKRGIFDFFNRNKHGDLAHNHHHGDHHHDHHLDHHHHHDHHLDHHHHHDHHDHHHHHHGAFDLHPMILTEADRWLAGCMMQCIFRKTHALDKHGYPTLDGIVDLYTDGIHDQFYFMYALRAVNKCLKIVSKRHSVKRSIVPLKAEACEISFDVFDCVSDAIAAYCH